MAQTKIYITDNNIDYLNTIKKELSLTQTLNNLISKQANNRKIICNITK